MIRSVYVYDYHLSPLQCKMCIVMYTGTYKVMQHTRSLSSPWPQAIQRGQLACSYLKPERRDDSHRLHWTKLCTALQTCVSKLSVPLKSKSVHNGRCTVCLCKTMQSVIYAGTVVRSAQYSERTAHSQCCSQG